MNMAIRELFLTITLLLATYFGTFAEVGEGGLVVGAERLPEYIHLLEGRRVGVLANNTSRIGQRHLVDSLLASGVDVKLLFAPEKGFRGDGVERHRDSYLGIEILTLRSRPRANDVFRCDVIVCDLQDEGVRTSASLRALVRVMQQCADIGVPLILLDRPNPNGRCVDGAIVESQYCTSEEVLPLPLLHGMTLGELARMINGEGWLVGGAKCHLTVVPYVESAEESGDDGPCAIYSVGLADNKPLIALGGGGIDLSQVVDSYKNRSVGEAFFIGEEFDSQIGAGYVRDMIEMDYTAPEIESMWSGDVERFSAHREKYLIYED